MRETQGKESEKSGEFEDSEQKRNRGGTFQWEKIASSVQKGPFDLENS